MSDSIGAESLLECLILEPGAIRQIVSYVQDRQFKRLVIAVDENTYESAGKELAFILKVADIKFTLCELAPNETGDVVADEPTLVQFMLELETGTDALVAVGSGTIHDIVRFVSHKCGIPFISVPTAPSVDGFTSAGAPLIIRGIKKTIPAVPPIAIFADLDILKKAPQRLVAAGFGDMLGKYTSLFDWKFSHFTAGEPYNEQVALITKQALESCVKHVQEIGKRTEEGIRVLMTALIESGLAMLMFGQSHPASGAEHHVSHYWEMEYLRRGDRALLHGAKVGVACAEISRLYHDAIERGDFPNAKPEQWDQYHEQIAAWLTNVPTDANIRGLLKQAGGPSTLKDLGIDDDLFRQSLKEAHQVRLNRHTLLRALNEA